MKPAARWRFGLLAGVALLLAAPLYINYVETLLRLLLWLFGIGLLSGGIALQRKGGVWAPNTLAARLNQRLRPGLLRLVAQGGAVLAHLGRVLVKGLFAALLRYRRTLLTALAGVTVLVFALGYQLPQTDAHPDWPELPHLKSAHLVVEHIPDFDARYGPRYAIPDSLRSYGMVDSPRVTAVRVLGHRVTQNAYEFGATNGYSNVGRYTPYPPTGWCFNQYGETYLEVNVAGQKGYGKGWYSSYEPPLRFIYQYNQPTRQQDTLLIHLQGEDYRIFIR